MDIARRSFCGEKEVRLVANFYFARLFPYLIPSPSTHVLEYVVKVRDLDGGDDTGLANVAVPIILGDDDVAVAHLFLLA